MFSFLFLPCEVTYLREFLASRVLKAIDLACTFVHALPLSRSDKSCCLSSQRRNSRQKPTSRQIFWKPSVTRWCVVHQSIYMSCSLSYVQGVWGGPTCILGALAEATRAGLKITFSGGVFGTTFRGMVLSHTYATEKPRQPRDVLSRGLVSDEESNDWYLPLLMSWYQASLVAQFWMFWHSCWYLT